MAESFDGWLTIECVNGWTAYPDIEDGWVDGLLGDLISHCPLHCMYGGGDDGVDG